MAAPVWSCTVADSRAVSPGDERLTAAGDTRIDVATNVLDGSAHEANSVSSARLKLSRRIVTASVADLDSCQVTRVGLEPKDLPSVVMSVMPFGTRERSVTWRLMCRFTRS